MAYKPGDLVTVAYPESGTQPAFTRKSRVKFVSKDGRVYVYCETPKCGYCGASSYHGNHRVGMSGSRII